jgi:peptidoglycan/xylan/chitin deacetylase (PgdA/CDA1 family)
LKAAILTYHSQNIAGSETRNNDHVALAADLDALHSAGYLFVSLDTLVKGLFDGAELPAGRPLICLTFDDGCDFDVRTLEFPGYGLQTGFLQIMEAFVSHQADANQPSLHATSFVIASPEARRLIDSKSLFGRGHMSDDWWSDANTHPLMTIGNHGWDHNHPDLPDAPYERGGFEMIDQPEHCHQQVVHAGEYIEQLTGNYPSLFAYPFGESSQYIRHEYFPSRQDEHHSLAAVGTTPGLVSANSDRWNLPRFVCGRDWSAPAELLDALDQDWR